MFRDRDDAGQQLALALAHYAGRPDVVVLGLPRGGVVVAARVAERLYAPLDVVVARKIPAPGHRELAMGALAVWRGLDAVVRNDHVIESARVSPEAFESDRHRELEVARRRAADWSPAPPDLAGRTVIVVDDGLATGATMRAALEVLRLAGAAHLVAAVPVGVAVELTEVRRRTDDVVCVLVPDRFLSVGSHYGDFGEVVDATVTRELELARRT
jgi:putative phosphoribosyl transferase